MPKGHLISKMDVVSKLSSLFLNAQLLVTSHCAPIFKTPPSQLSNASCVQQ